METLTSVALTPDHAHQPLRVVRLQISDYMAIKACDVTLDPADPMVFVCGKNGAGKSTLLSAIFDGIAGGRSFTANPIREGADEATIQIDLGEMIICRKFRSDGKMTLKITAKDGSRLDAKRPQAILDAIYDKFTLDPLQFMQMKPLEQRTSLLEIVPLDIDLDDLIARRKTTFEERTEVSRQLTNARGFLSKFDDLPEERPKIVSIAEAMAERGKIDEATGLRQSLVVAHHDAETELDSCVKEVSETDELVARMEAKLAATKAKRVELQQEVKALCSAVETSAQELDQFPLSLEQLHEQREAINETILSAEEINKTAGRWDECAAVKQEVNTLEENVAMLTDKLDNIETEKINAIQAAEMPLPGISVDDDFVLWNGRPLKDAATSEQFMVSAALALAREPKLRIIRIRDGSLLDEDNLQILRNLAHDEQYQVVTEFIDKTNKTGIVIEEGIATELTQETIANAIEAN